LEQYAALSAAGDRLERLAAGVDFALLCGSLRSALQRSDWGKGGRLPFDPVMMFTILVFWTLCCPFGSRARLRLPEPPHGPVIRHCRRQSARASASR
jgi:hypothetical protein